MALEKDEEWILPENLRRQEKEEIAKVDRNLDASGGDFGSYYRLLKDQNDDWARSHAVIDDAEADLYAGQVATALEADGPTPKDLALLDVGCGPGPITAALRRRLGGSATGVDISESGTAYGRRRFPDCAFLAAAVDENLVLPQKYDVIHAREFYPFTRTGDLETHRRYLDILLKYLKPGGVVVLTVLAEPKSLADNAPALAPDRRVLVAGERFARLLPLPAARVLTWAAQSLVGRPRRYFYIWRR